MSIEIKIRLTNQIIHAPEIELVTNEERTAKAVLCRLSTPQARRSLSGSDGPYIIYFISALFHARPLGLAQNPLRVHDPV